MSTKLVINRLHEGIKSTLGQGILYINNKIVFTFVTIELPNLHNQINISSIPALTYEAEVITRPNGQKSIFINEVPDRKAILIHVANFYTDLLGCIGVGSHFAYINNDNYVDVANSTKTMQKLLSFLPDEGITFTLEINKIIA